MRPAEVNALLDLYARTNGALWTGGCDADRFYAQAVCLASAKLPRFLSAVTNTLRSTSM